LDIRAVVANEENLIAAETWYQDGSTATGVKIAYKGMLVSVEDTNAVYMCIDPTNITSLTLGWKKVNPDLDISGEMIDVVLANDNKYYDKNDCTWDAELEKWIPNQGAESIDDPQVNAEGKYLCLQLNEDDKVYIKSTDLIDLKDYYTK
jgi:predicted peptidase